LTDVSYQKSVGALPAELEIPAIELLIAGSLASLTIAASEIVILRSAQYRGPLADGGSA
jgi:hypothetical protein